MKIYQFKASKYSNYKHKTNNEYLKTLIQLKCHFVFMSKLFFSFYFWIGFLILTCMFTGYANVRNTNEECFECHKSYKTSFAFENGESLTLTIPEKNYYAKDIHANEIACTNCHHQGYTNDDHPHLPKQPSLKDYRIKRAEICKGCHPDAYKQIRWGVHSSQRKKRHKNPVCTDCHKVHEINSKSAKKCGNCHTQIRKKYTESLHGKAARRGDPLAPTCTGCHGSHIIKSKNNQNSPTYVMNIPSLCGKCHHEGSKVELTHDIHQGNALENYSLSIHGKGIFERGLIVSAVCSNCHKSHHILTHTDPRSSIHKNNVAKTCTQCHAQIVKVHRQVIDGELWQKEPHKIPVCIDCHSPHKIRRVFYEKGMANNDCLHCHENKDTLASRGADAEKMFVDTTIIAGSIHKEIMCSQCHTGGSVSHERPCETFEPRVDCSVCHDDEARLYKKSIHGIYAKKGETDAPYCTDCHGTHNTLGQDNLKSPTFPQHIPDLCGECHRMGEKAAVRYKGKETEVVKKYVESIHGKGLLESGLTVTATCSDCHTAHFVKKADDSTSSVFPAKIGKTCSGCHLGIYTSFQQSIHSPLISTKVDSIPTCNNCHSAHSIQRTDKTNFQLHISEQCGHCHEEVMETYFETYHGKVSKLGYTKTAKCYDCHTAHDILPHSDTSSSLHESNVVKTCGKCHPKSNKGFTGYLTHASHNDRDNYPLLFYSFWGMTCLLLGTLLMFGIHTLIWLPRSIEFRSEIKKAHKNASGKYVQRFTKFYRKLHMMMVISFFSLAITGMMLKFSYTGWARQLSIMLGGFENAGFIHRIAAIVTGLYFILHLWDLLLRKHREAGGFYKLFFGPNTMIPTLTDLHEVIGSIKWFFALGPRPKYGRWTYWEKFDYFAVFWGLAIIGSTGIMLWFPEFCTQFLPGWLINVATIIHGDEALLAVCFIFTIHFFNTHFRPEKFPMDPVIFTGSIPLEEFKLDRPREYEQLVASGKLEERFVEPPSKDLILFCRIFGFTALSIGVTLVLCIIYALLFA